MGFAEGAQPAFDQGRVGQHPAVQGGVIDLEAALEEQLLDVTVAERIAQIPGDGLQDQRRFVVAALEIVLRPALQLLDKGVQDHRPPPVRRRICRPQAQRGVNAKTLRQPRSKGPFLRQHDPASPVVWPSPTPVRPAACATVGLPALSRDGSPPMTRTPLPPCRAPSPGGSRRVPVSIASPLTRPSPFPRRVGIRIFTFEARSGFTRVSAPRVSQPPQAALFTRLHPPQLPHQTPP